MWAANARGGLEVEAPTHARTIAEHAINFLGEIIDYAEGLEREVADLKAKLMAARLGKPDAEKKPAPTADAAGVREPRIFWEGKPWPDTEGVQLVEDDTGDKYEFNKANGKWSLLGHDGKPVGSSYDLKYLVNEYGPIVEVGPGVRKVRWFSEDLDGNKDWDFPEPPDFWDPDYGKVMHVLDGEGDHWDRVYTKYNLFTYDGWSADERKEDGYWTPYRIVDDTGSVMMVPREKRPTRLHWGKGEDEPHETIKLVFNPTTNWYYQRQPDGTWVAPGVGDGMRRKHSSDSISWKALLGNSGNDLTEYVS